MTILFSISLLAFCTLLWASLSIARHIRASTRVRKPAVEIFSVPSPNRHFHHQPFEDLNHPPFVRRIHQQPTRTAPRQKDIAS